MHAVRAAARAGAGMDAGARARARAQSGARSGAAAGARGRIVVLNGLPDAPQHYVALTNAVFSAQKAYIPVDALALDVNTPSPYLQVAAKVTGGSYSQRPGEGRGLLEALLCVAGADLHSRRFLAAPPAPAVDFRPVDFVTKVGRARARARKARAVRARTPADERVRPRARPLTPGPLPLTHSLSLSLSLSRRWHTGAGRRRLRVLGLPVGLRRARGPLPNVWHRVQGGRHGGDQDWGWRG